MTPTTTAPDPTSLKRAREYFEIAVRHHQRNELREAEAAYRRAIEHDPRLPEAHNNLGVALRARGEDDAALDAFRTAVALRSNYAEALNNVALSLATRGEHRAAVEHLRSALARLDGVAATPPVRAQLLATLGA